MSFSFLLSASPAQYSSFSFPSSLFFSSDFLRSSVAFSSAFFFGLLLLFVSVVAFATSSCF